MTELVSNERKLIFSKSKDLFKLNSCLKVSVTLTEEENFKFWQKVHQACNPSWSRNLALVYDTTLKWTNAQYMNFNIRSKARRSRNEFFFIVNLFLKVSKWLLVPERHDEWQRGLLLRSSVCILSGYGSVSVNVFKKSTHGFLTMDFKVHSCSTIFVNCTQLWYNTKVAN